MNINWKEIEKENKKAFVLFCDKFNVGMYTDLEKFCYCEIEKFFDEYMIGYLSAENRLIERILTAKNNQILTKEIKKEAKEQAIIKAFEILENKLKGE